VANSNWSTVPSSRLVDYNSICSLSAKGRACWLPIFWLFLKITIDLHQTDFTLMLSISQN